MSAAGRDFSRFPENPRHGQRPTLSVRPRSFTEQIEEGVHMAQPGMLSIANVAKASISAYNDKNWDKVRATLTADCLYDEVATNRKAKGIDEVLAIWQGWAKALPDSKATFGNQFVTDNTVVLEITWRGTHTGPMATPRGEIPPTGKTIELRACQVIEVSGERAKSIRQYFDMATLTQQLGVML
jgi:steroid delta-isomerase-like uncharacterized protein